jgi:hypothetical protein
MVSHMVAPFLAEMASDVLSPFGDFATATIHLVDYDTADTTRPASMKRVATPETDELTAELDGATEWLNVAPDEILLAALARTVACTLGDGIVPIDVASEGRSLLDSVPLACATKQQVGATEVLLGVHRTLATATERVGDGPSEVYFNFLGEVADESIPVPVQEAPPSLGHALEVRVYRTGGLVHVDWWYDTSRFEAYTVEELTEQFPLALIEMTSDALPPQ